MEMSKALKPIEHEKDISNSLTILFDEYDAIKKDIDALGAYSSGKGEALSYFIEGNGGSGHAVRDLFNIEGAMSALNATFWSRALGMTDVREVMPAKRRSEWDEFIRDKKTPEFERDSVIRTIADLLMSREKFMAERVDGVFKSLSSNHITNSPMGFRKRMILERVVEENKNYHGCKRSWSTCYNGRIEEIHDLRKVIDKIRGRDNANYRRTTDCDITAIIKEDGFGQWHEFDGGAFKIRIYKKGTAHIEINDDIARKLNKILAFLYPSAIPTKHQTKKKDFKKQEDLAIDILSVELVGQLYDPLDSLRRGNNVTYPSYRSDEPSKKLQAEVEEILRSVGGTQDGRTWTFIEGADMAISKIIRTGVVPNKKAYQQYYTSEELAERVQIEAEIGATETVLEPSAGQGALVEGLDKNNVLCVELSPLNAEILAGKGYEVHEGDFLDFKNKHQFDKILMNPPFNKNQAETHVTKAAQMLTNCGTLVSIVPASLKDKEIVEGYNHEYSEVISDSFVESGTKVNVVILKLTRKGA